MNGSRIATVLAVTICALAAAVTPAVATTTPPTPVSTGHSQWAWGSPSPQGHDLAAVSFQGATGYAVGSFGTILRSTDSGASWTGLPSTTLDTLDLVQELSPTTVIAAGGCSALESTDSGRSFTTMALGLDEQVDRDGQVSCPDPVAGIAFTDRDDGFVLLRNGTLESTADGGVRFSAVNPVPVGGGHATGLLFSSPTTGLAITSGGLIERTSDGGHSWTQVDAAPTGLLGVTVVSPTLAYAVGTGGELERSVDGGATWTALPLTLPNGVSRPDLTSITCAGGDDCLIATTNSDAIVRTTDGGQTGTVLTGTGDALTAVAYAAGTTVAGVGEDGATAVSGDGGETFEPASAGLPSGVVPNGPLVAGFTRGTAYLPVDDGVLSTADAGRSWTVHRIPVQAGEASFTSVAFTSPTTGFALDADQQLFHTSDGGTRWSPFAEGHSAGSTIVAPSPHALLLIGPHGVFRSTDGGARFYRVAGRLGGTGPVLSSLRLDAGFAVHDTVVAYHTGRPDRIIVSTDGGRAWRAVPEPALPPGGTIDVSATSATRLWIYDYHTLWSTSTGGRHWSPEPAVGRLGFDSGGDGYEAGEVSFSSPRDGVIALVGPTNAHTVSDPLLTQVSMLRTTDGGRTWAPEILGGNTGDGAQVLATSQGDLAAQDTQPGAPGAGVGTGRIGIGLFTTAGTTQPAHRLSLRVGFGHVVRGRVLVSGRVAPVMTPDVAVSYRVDDGPWEVAQARVASDGAFRMSLTHVRTSAAVVAQAVGTSTVAGAGTPEVTLTVGR